MPFCELAQCAFVRYSLHLFLAWPVVVRELFPHTNLLVEQTDSRVIVCLIAPLPDSNASINHATQLLVHMAVCGSSGRCMLYCCCCCHFTFELGVTKNRTRPPPPPQHTPCLEIRQQRMLYPAYKQTPFTASNTPLSPTPKYSPYLVGVRPGYCCCTAEVPVQHLSKPQPPPKMLSPHTNMRFRGHARQGDQPPPFPHHMYLHRGVR